MNFADPGFLSDHIRTIFDFYHPRCIDRENGGFYHHFRDDDSIYAAATRHLVSSARFVFNYAMAASYFQNAEYESIAEHGLAFLKEAHWQPDTQSDAWTLKNRNPDDKTNHRYGLAFVLLASATALKVEIASALPQTRLQLADSVCRKLAALGGGLIWEHDSTKWQIDWEYNKGDPKNLFRPWGFQPGHRTEPHWHVVCNQSANPYNEHLLPPCLLRLNDCLFSRPNFATLSHRRGSVRPVR